MALSPDAYLRPNAAVEARATLNESCAQAMSRQLAGELDLAAQMYRAILQADPQHAAANHCLGMLLVQSKRPAEGLPNLVAAIAADPQVADYWLGYLEALFLAGQTDEAKSTLALARQHGLEGSAVEAFAARMSVKLLPTPTPAPSSRPADPVRAERRRTSRAADKLESQVLAQVKERNFAAAQASARVLTQRFPERGLGWKILGASLAADGRTDDAVAAMQQAARLLPNDAEALCNLGVLLTTLERFQDAEACLQQAIAIDPKSDAASLYLGSLYAAQDRFPEAVPPLRRAIAGSKPTDYETNDIRHSSLLFLLSHDAALGAADLFAEHVAIGRWLEGPLAPVPPKFFNDREPERRLKVGFVSGDFRIHAVSNFIEPILEKLRNHDGLELHAFYNHEIEDDTTRRMRRCFAEWHVVSKMSDLELVTLIKASRIDILIDLSSHTACNRLRALAQKAAPLQVSWMGYPGTTGLRSMDYYLADRYFLPPGHYDDSFTEKIAYLPASSSFRPHADSPPVNGLPALEAGFVTFGSFNRMGKINPFTIRLWSRLLREMPDSIMIVAGVPLDDRRRALTALFNAEGIATERLAFFPRSSMQTYLALHNQVDICLDTFPYTGGTTTNHALWMGVPTLTLVGRTPASRQTAANLLPLGLEAFIAENPDDFVAKGLRWATELTALAEVRHSLRERWLASPTRQTEIIASGLDDVLRHMWRRWCAHLPAESFNTTAAPTGA